MIRIITIIAGLAISACAASGPKPIVQPALKLEGKTDIQTHTCGELGCDEAVKKMCGTQTVQIIDKSFVDNSQQVQNQTTGQWQRNKRQSTVYKFRCTN